MNADGKMKGTVLSLCRWAGLGAWTAMVAVDPRRRPVAASTAYAFVLFGLMVWRLGSLPAYRGLVPAPGETLVALVLTLAAGVAGGFMAGRLAVLLEPASTPEG